MSEPVHLRIDSPLPGVSRITLNRPEKRNALNNLLRTELFATLEHNDQDPSVRVTVIRGAGPAFCAGHDLRQMHGQRRLDYYRTLFAACAEVMALWHHIAQSLSLAQPAQGSAGSPTSPRVPAQATGLRA